MAAPFVSTIEVCLQPPFLAGTYGHTLVDQYGRPYWLAGDSSQDLMWAVSSSDALFLIQTRAAQGFNAMFGSMIGGPYENGNASWATFDGVVPFFQSDGVTLGTGPANYDVTHPNPAYWARVETVVQYAQQYGITLLFEPLGSCVYHDNQTFYTTMGQSKLNTYATWLANRFKAYPNLHWHWGDDYFPVALAGESQSAQAVGDTPLSGMRDTMAALWPIWMHTVELNDGVHFPATSANLDLSTDDANWASRVSFIWHYDSRQNSPDLLRAYNRSPTLPYVFGEGVYEASTKGALTGTPLVLRSYLYNPLLSGASGSFYGHGVVWSNGTGWKSDLSTTGAGNVTTFLAFIAGVQWWNLVPDQSATFATAGATTAAVDAVGSLGVVYGVQNTGITVAMSKMRATTTARWFDPTNGTYTSLGTFANTGTHTFTQASLNAAGDNDWVLLLTA